MPSGAKRTRTSCATTYNGLRSICRVYDAFNEDADYDALFQQAQATADDAEQTELYKQMERNLTEHAANVYIQDLADLVVLRNGLEGYQFYPIYVMDLSTVHYAQ